MTFNITDISLTDVIGTLGVALIVLGYFNVQSGRWSHRDMILPLVNLCGSLMVLVSLYDSPNLPSILIEVIWTLISLYGLWHVYRLKRKNKEKDQ